MRLTSILIVAALAAAPTRADAALGGAGADFLKVEHGARGTGMAGAFTAVVDDGNALWWNPAGLGWMPFKEVMASHVSALGQVSSELIGVAYPLDPKIGTLGASFSYMNIPGLTSYDANGVAGGKITANAFTLGLAFGRKIIEQVTAGVHMKLIGQKLDTESGRGFSCDVGLQARQAGFSAGLAVLNVGPSFNMAGNGSNLPTVFRGGLAWAPIKRLALSVEEEGQKDGEVVFHGGAEFKASQAFALRGGWQQVRDAGGAAGISMGVGYQAMIGGSQGGGSGWAGEDTPWWDRKNDEFDGGKPEGAYAIFVDYAFVTLGTLGDTHRVTLGVRF